MILSFVLSPAWAAVTAPTFVFRRRRSDGVDPVVWRDGTARATVAPLALTSNVMAGLVHFSGAPGLVLCQVGRDPGTLGVDHTIEPEGEDAGLMG